MERVNDATYVHHQIELIADHLQKEGLSNGTVYRLILGELESWFMHIEGLVGWWIT